MLVQTTIPGEGEAGFQTIIAASSGRPANSARMTVRLAPRRPDGSTRSTSPTRSRRSRPTATTSPSPRPPASARTASTSSSRATTPRRSAANDAVLAALADNDDLLNLKSDLSKGTPEIQVTPDPNKSIMVGLTAAQVAQEVRGALVGTVATRGHRRGRHDRDLRPARPDQRDLGRRPRHAARRHRASRCRWARSRRSSRSTPRARSPASTGPPRPRSARRSPTRTRAR